MLVCYLLPLSFTVQDHDNQSGVGLVTIWSKGQISSFVPHVHHVSETHGNQQSEEAVVFQSVTLCAQEPIHFKQQVKHSVITARGLSLNQCRLHPLHVYVCLVQSESVCEWGGEESEATGLTHQHSALISHQIYARKTSHCPRLSYSLQLSPAHSNRSVAETFTHSLKWSSRKEKMSQLCMQSCGIKNTFTPGKK